MADDDTAAPDISKRRRESQGSALKRPHDEVSNERRRVRFVPQPGRSTATESSSRGREHERDYRHRDADSRKRLRDDEDEQKLHEKKYRYRGRDYSGSMGDRESGSRRFSERGLRTIDDMTDKYWADLRCLDAKCFRRKFTNGCNSIERKECIWAHKKVSRSGKSCGVMWVGVQGMDSICVVTRKENLEQELTRPVGKGGTECLLRIFKNGVIWEVEDLGDPTGIKYENSDQSIEKPFAVVSVIPGNNKVDKVSGHEAPGAEYDVDKASKFLQDEMNSDAAFTFDKTMQTAVSALQHLFLKTFEANEIRVFVWKKDAHIVEELQQTREGLDVEEHLAVINELDS